MATTETTVQQLAEKLHVSEKEIRLWASEFSGNKEHIEGDYIPRIVANFVKTMHLRETHPDIYKMLSEIYSPELAYERWICVIQDKLRE